MNPQRGRVLSLAVVDQEVPSEAGAVRGNSSGGAAAGAAPALQRATAMPQAADSVVVPSIGETVDETADVNAGWVELVERIRLEKTDGMEELYQLFSRGIRFYLCRQLGPQELDDKWRHISIRWSTTAASKPSSIPPCVSWTLVEIPKKPLSSGSESGSSDRF